MAGVPLTVAEYHSHPALSRSQLAWLHESPEKYRAGMDGRIQFAASTEKAFANGTAVHDVVAGITGRVAIIPEDVLAKNGARSTNDYRRWKAEQPADAVIMRASELDTVYRQGARLREELGQFIDDRSSIAERPIVWTETVMRDSGWESDIQCRCLPDLWWPHGVVIDWKTMLDLPTESSFRRAARRGCYWLQDAHYSAGIMAEHGGNPMRFLFACVQKSEPYQCAVFELDADTRARAASERRRLLIDLAERRESGNWRSYPPGKCPIQRVNIAEF